MGVLQAHVFMSDDDPNLQNACHATMGEKIPVTYLNCSWHTYRACRKNIASKISAAFSEKAVVHQILRVLTDGKEEGEFYKKCKGFLSNILESRFKYFHD